MVRIVPEVLGSWGAEGTETAITFPYIGVETALFSPGHYRSYQYTRTFLADFAGAWEGAAQ